MTCISDILGCYRCRYADMYGRSCEHGMMFPVLLAISGADRCPNREDKTAEQIADKIRYEQLKEEME